MSEVKSFLKGDIIFSEGDKITQLYVIQSGTAAVGLYKDKKWIEIFTVNSQHILGESILWGSQTYNFSAVATSELKLIPIPIESIKLQFENLNPLMKVVQKSVYDRYKLSLQEIKSYRIEKQLTPLPADQVQKIFAALYFSVLSKGKPIDQSKALKVDWPNFKNYLFKVFAEPIKRQDSILQILSKLQQVDLIYGRAEEDPDGPDLLIHVIFKNPQLIENFFEFYQHYFYKSDKKEILSYDEYFTKLLDIIFQQSQSLPIDRNGNVRIDFKVTSELAKDQLQMSLGPEHFTRLENKGVFIKRGSLDGQAYLEFHKQEIEQMLFFWKLINEIDKYNQFGFVKTEELIPNNKSVSTSSCPICQAKADSSDKFCSSCGAKLIGAAA